MSGSSSQQSSSSSNASTSIGFGGDNNGIMNNGDGNTFTTTDFGAVEGALSFASNFGSSSLEVALNSNENMASVAETGLSLADSLGGAAFDLAGDMASTNAELTNSLASSFLGAGSSMFGTGAELLDSAGKRNLDAAMVVHSTGLQQLEMGTDFISKLNQQSLDTNLLAQKDNNDALTGGFKSAMQFVEGFSRSDGAAVAETNMKTIGLLSLAAIGVAFALKKGK
jgi:poly-gamma-glutamate capsule biosynthesis protein CapA/YwtB (metallophosphatase superfamily)